MEATALDLAEAAVARDLQGRHLDVLARCVKSRRWWVEQWAEGGQFLVCLLAQDVQEGVHTIDPLWPLCAEHGDHALGVEPDLGTDPFWVCGRSGLPVAPVGTLH